LAADGPAKNHLFAFARVAHKQVNSSASSSPATNDQPPHAAIVVVPRLTTTLVSESALAPLGAEAWSDTVIQLPDQLSDRKWTCALTREQLQSSADGKLSVPDALRSFPVALLLSDVRPPVAL
jgi:maltooligosyltrehalose synthase